MSSNYKTYAGVTAGITSVLMRIQGGTMPQSGPLSQADQAAVKAWYAGGMPDADPATSGALASCNAGTLTPTAPAAPPALIPTYAGGVKTIMSAYCVSCHSAAGGTSPHLDTLASVKSNYGNIISTITSGSMPRPRTATSKLDANTINLMKQWGTSPNAPYGQYAP